MNLGILGRVPRSYVPSLTTKTRPRYAVGANPLRVVDLFAGCGGLTLGIQQAAIAAGLAMEVPLAIDFEVAATGVYKANFPFANVITDSVEAYFDGDLGSPLTETEVGVREKHPTVHLLVGGPPCQGHSNLNNKTRRKDPKNLLYARMGRAAEVLVPAIVLIENVPTVRLDTDQVVQTTVRHLELLGYEVATDTIALRTLGVAQTRKRHVLLASRVPSISPGEILAALSVREAEPGHDLRWAIGDLATLAETDRLGYDVPPVPSQDNIERMHYLLDNNLFDLPNEMRPVCHQNAHSYKSMYGRLRWSEPAQTLTSGFGSIGQGRYMHPDLPRALTAHEAARIQGFPDYFSFASVNKRGDMSVMIGNAVPPALTRSIVALLIPDLAIEGFKDSRASTTSQRARATVAAEPDLEIQDFNLAS